MRAISFFERVRAREGSRDEPPPSKPPASVTAQNTRRSPESQWFWDHYEMAAIQVIEAFASVGASLENRTVADIGCGDGIMDLGVAQRARPARLVGFDLNATDTEYLARRAAEEGVPPSASALSFERSQPSGLPAENASFDFAFSWSAFEHIAEPIEVLSEIRRVLRPQGVFFLQLWPFYHSAKGSHLWEWYPEDFHHLRRPESKITQELLGSDLKPPDWTQMMAREFQQLNRVTVDELQRSMLAAGLVTRRVELLASPTLLAPDLARYSWLDLCVSGIKVMATPS